MKSRKNDKMRINAFGHTDIGKKRELNEDNYICLALSEENSSPYLLAVADGMGGHSGGETASAMAIDVLRESLTSHLKSDQDALSRIQTILEDSIQKANDQIFQEASEEKQLTGMGTTLVAAFISDNTATVSNIGDSRAYLIRRHSIQQVTADHTWKAEQLRTQALTEEEILNSPFRDLITRYIGLKPDLKIDTYELELSDNDYLLLCTDGLHTLIKDEEIYETVMEIEDPETICRKLIKTANKRGGHDNITVVVGKVQGTKKAAHRSVQQSDTVKLDSSDR